MSWHRKHTHRHPLAEGPPRLLRFLLVVFVTVGGLAAGVWYTTRETPKVEAREGSPRWKLHQ